MAFAHNAMIRGINSIYNQAPYVHRAKHIAEFLVLRQILGGLGLEKVMGKAGFLQSNLDQHHAFEPGLKELEAFANQTKVEDYKPDVLRGIIDDSPNRLQGHLNDEISSLLAMRPYYSAGLLAVYKKCEAAAGTQDKG